MAIWDTERDIEKPDSTDLGDFTKKPRYARIVNVFDANCLGVDKDKYGKVEVVWLDGGGSPRQLIPFTMPWFSWSRGAGIMFMPEVNDVVVCQQRTNGYPVIIGFIPHNWKGSTDQVNLVSPTNVGNTRPLYKGEVCVKGSSGNEIVLDKLGNVTITSVDTGLSENVIASDVEGINNENMFSRTQDKVRSLQTSTVVGNSYLYDGSPVQVGNASQVFESGLYSTVYTSVTLDFNGENIDIPLGSDTFITRLDSVLFTTDDTNLVSFKENKDFIITCQTVYNQGNDNPNELGYRPATTERNTVIYTINPLSSKMKKSKGNLIVKYYSKIFISGVRINNLGDLFLDGRNVVIRSAKEKASLVINDDGEALLRGSSNTVIGNQYEGSVKTDSSGVNISLGIGSTAEAPNTQKDGEDLDPTTYYYVSDDLPLIKLFKEGETWQFSAVTDSEYSNLSNIDKSQIKKLWVSESTYFLTLQKLQELWVDGIHSYGDLKKVRV